MSTSRNVARRSMLIGMDEAGYGPNLGPLVITTTAWEVPGDPRDVSLWESFSKVITQEPHREPDSLWIGDSKQVYSPQKGLHDLELGALVALGLLGPVPRSWNSLWQLLDPNSHRERISEPWFGDADLELPRVASIERIEALVSEWKRECDEHDSRLTSIQSDIVLTGRFNDLVDSLGGKGRALTRASLALLTRSLPADPEISVLALADKHGGRNRYQEFLHEIADGAFVGCLGEGTASSRYRFGQTEVRFETNSERHFPVALASMVGKYVRELAMTLFNDFWMTRIPNLRPTAGYPVDAARFRSQIEEKKRDLAISDRVLWRNK